MPPRYRFLRYYFAGLPPRVAFQLPGAAAFDAALDRIAVDAAAVLGAAGGETDLIAAQPAVCNRRGIAAGLERAGEHLESLLERELALRQLPRAFDLRRHDPQVGGAVIAAAAGFVDRDGFVVLPFPHRERIRHDARAGFEVEDFRAQLEIDVRQQKHRDDGRLAEIGFEQVGLQKIRLAGHARLLGVAFRQLDHVGVVFDPGRARAAFGRGDHGAAVAGTQVHHIIVRGDFGGVEHFVDQRLRGRNPHHVLAFLTDLRLERFLRGLCLGKYRGGENRRQQRRPRFHQTRCEHD